MKYLYILLLILPLIGFGQGWEQTLGGENLEHGYWVQQTLDGGYIITGQVGIMGQLSNVGLIKTNGIGEEEWSQNFGGENSEVGYSVQQTNDGGYIIVGKIYLGGSNWDVFLIKTDFNGNIEWSQNFGGENSDVGLSVQQTSDGGYIITGSTFLEGENQLILIKVNEYGDLTWSKNPGFSSVGRSVQQTNDGGYIITGVSNHMWSDLILIKTDLNGELVWEKFFGGNNNDSGQSVQQTSDGGYIITGTYQINDLNYDVYLIKTDINGDEEWSKIFGDENNDSGNSVQQTIDGGYIITGTYETDYLNYDVYLIKTDINGDEEWVQTFGGENEDNGHSVQQTSDSGYIITGNTNSFGGGSYDIYLIKTDPQGNVTSTIELPITTTKRELIKTTNILGQENTTIKNQPMIEIYDDGSVEKRYIIE